jgi:hypothetical protein
MYAPNRLLVDDVHYNLFIVTNWHFKKKLHITNYVFKRECMKACKQGKVNENKLIFKFHKKKKVSLFSLW